MKQLLIATMTVAGLVFTQATVKAGGFYPLIPVPPVPIGYSAAPVLPVGPVVVPHVVARPVVVHGPVVVYQPACVMPPAPAVAPVPAVPVAPVYRRTTYDPYGRFARINHKIYTPYGEHEYKYRYDRKYGTWRVKYDFDD